MKKIIKVDGIITNVKRLNKNMSMKYNPKNPASAFISYRVNGHMKTSSNTIQVRFNAKNGEHMQVCYVEGRPERVFRCALTARLFSLGK